MWRTGRGGTNYVAPLTPLLSLHLSSRPSPASSSPTESLALHLSAEHSGHGDIERGIERSRQRGRESDGENIDSPVLVCSVLDPQGYGTRDGEGARREGEKLCWRGESGNGGVESARERGYSVAAESPPACLLRSTSD